MKFNRSVMLLLLITSAALSFKVSAEEVPLFASPALILEPHLVSIILNDEHRQGVDWEAIVTDYHALVLKNDNGIDSGKNKISVGTVSDEDYGVLLDALDTVGQVTQSTQESVTLNAGEKKKVDFVNSSSPSGLKKLIFVDTELLITPKGEKQLVLSPNIQSRTATTTIDLKENTTIVLGSILSEHEVTKTHKFPLLGDLPIVGLVFRNKGRLMQKIETILFISSKG